MYFHKLADITANELKHSISDVVISVPGWFSEVQRRAILDAANIAGLNPLRLINDTTAIALGYGITKSDLPDPENPRHVVFVDIGHSNYSVAVVAFAKGELKVKSAAFDRHFGGRDLDLALVQHFAHEFKDKYKIDVLSSQKATFRLATQCERLKKVLSANFEAPLAVENIMNDIDASSKLNREQFESLITELLTRVTNPLQEALQEAGLTAAQIDAVELVGGTTRVPAIKDRIKAFFGNKALSTTLNADEAVARGATFACAKLSPVFKVRNFEFKDIAPYSIKIQWQPSPFDQEEDTELVVFPRGNELPSTKLLTFYRESTFEVEAVYAEPSKLPGTINPWIGKVTAKIDKRDIQGEKIAHVKVKTRLNGNGLLSFEGAYLQEETEEEVPAPMDVDPAAAPNGAPEQPSPPQKKKKVIKRDIPIVPGSRTLDPSILNTLKEQEANMHASDKLIMDTEVNGISIVRGAYMLMSLHRIAKMLSKSMSTICEAKWTTSTLPTSNPPRRRSSLPRYKMRRTGSTARKEKTLPSQHTLPSSIISTLSEIPSPNDTKRLNNVHKQSANCAKRLIFTTRKRHPMTSVSPISTRRTNKPLSRRLPPFRNGSMIRSRDKRRGPRTSIPS
jgi:heat shock protein 4